MQLDQFVAESVRRTAAHAGLCSGDLSLFMQVKGFPEKLADRVAQDTVAAARHAGGWQQETNLDLNLRPDINPSVDLDRGGL